MSTPRQNSVRQLAELYNVVIGVALSLAIYNSVDTTSTFLVPIKHEQILNVFTFVVIIVPFYHGAVRHLFATYVEDGGSTRIKNGALLADFFLLFLEGCLFVMMAAILHDTVKFATVLIALLVLDSVWGFLAWLAFTGAQSQYAERTWAIINMIAAAFIALILIFADEVFSAKPLLSQAGLFAIIAVRTVIDYFFCWTFYFPEHASPTPHRSEELKP